MAEPVATPEEVVADALATAWKRLFTDPLEPQNFTVLANRIVRTIRPLLHAEAAQQVSEILGSADDLIIGMWNSLDEPDKSLYAEAAERLSRLYELALPLKDTPSKWNAARLEHHMQSSRQPGA